MYYRSGILKISVFQYLTMVSGFEYEVCIT
uniref:Uncharacterized protein n=1 Tax=Lepeophtheirus salmonis TaxID=72036 RepID=A0A0K2TJ37_LEPSM